MSQFSRPRANCAPGEARENLVRRERSRIFLGLWVSHKDVSVTIDLVHRTDHASIMASRRTSPASGLVLTGNSEVGRTQASCRTGVYDSENPPITHRRSQSPGGWDSIRYNGTPAAKCRVSLCTGVKFISECLHGSRVATSTFPDCGHSSDVRACDPRSDLVAHTRYSS